MDKRGQKQKQKLRVLNKPKRPATSFFLFLSDQRRTVTRQPGDKETSWAKLQADQWAALSAAEKIAYKERSVKLRDKFQ